MREYKMFVTLNLDDRYTIYALTWEGRFQHTYASARSCSNALKAIIGWKLPNEWVNNEIDSMNNRKGCDEWYRTISSENMRKAILAVSGTEGSGLGNDNYHYNILTKDRSGNSGILLMEMGL